MRNSRSEQWCRIRDLEDVLALLVGVDEQRQIIKTRAWVIGDEQSFIASERQRELLGRLKRVLSGRWEELMEERGG